MEMTFQQYIDNPLGKKNAVFSSRNMYKEMYERKYGAVLLRENGTFQTKFYYDKKGDRYICYMKVPSEVVEKFYYDVVIEFYPIDALNGTSNSIENYGVRFFSNDPAFVFTYEYVFFKNDMFIKELKSKASKLAIKNAPDERNPYQIPGYVKSLYFCFLHMKNKGLFHKSYWKQYSEKINWMVLNAQIEQSDKKVSERQRLGEEVKKKKAKEKKDGTGSNERMSVGVRTKTKEGSTVRVIKPKSPISKKSSNVRTIKHSNRKK